MQKARSRQSVKTGNSGPLLLQSCVIAYYLAGAASGAAGAAFFAACFIFLADLAFLTRVDFFTVALAGSAGVAAGALAAAGAAAGVAGAAGVAAKAVPIAKVAAIKVAISLFMLDSFWLGPVDNRYVLLITQRFQTRLTEYTNNFRAGLLSLQKEGLQAPMRMRVAAASHRIYSRVLRNRHSEILYLCGICKKTGSMPVFIVIFKIL